MQYDAAQLRTLNAMGLVPWVLREPGADAAGGVAPSEIAIATPAEAAPDSPIPVTTADSPPLVMPRAAVHEMASPLPDNAESLAHWLPLQALMPGAEASRGVRESDTSQAGLLVLFESLPARSEPGGDVNAAVAVPGSAGTSSPQSRSGLKRESFRLFEAMVRSIDLSLRDLTLARLAPQALPDGDTVADLLASPYRAMLVMVHGDSAADPAQPWADAARFELQEPRLSGWRCPHPDSLLSDPLRKRDAWQVLKAVRRALAAGTA